MSLIQEDDTDEISQQTEQKYVADKVVYQTLMLSSFQTAASFLLEWCPNLIVLFFLGRDGKEQVAGFGLGIMWVNCFGIGFLNGLACGLETMVSQAFGAEKYKVCGAIYNRAIAIIIVLMIPIFFLQFFGQNILSQINSNQSMLDNAGIVTVTMIPAIFLNGIYVTTKCFLNGQNIFNYQLITQFIVTILHVVWSYLFIEYLRLGLVGASLARFCTEALSNIILFTIIKRTKCSDGVILKFDATYFTNWWPFLRVAMPIGALLWLEWLCYECYAIQASFLSEEKFATNVIMINFGTFFYQFAYGISIAATTYVGSGMGRKQQGQAKKYASASLIMTSVFLAITQILLYIFRVQFSSVFTINQHIQGEILNSYIFLQIFLVLDCTLQNYMEAYQAVFTGIVRGIGRENNACISFLFFYLFVGQAASYLFCFTAGLDLNGIWLGLIIGAGGYDILQVFNLILSNWTNLVDQIQKKIYSQGYQQLQMKKSINIM